MSLSLMGASFLEQLPDGEDKRWSGVSFTASKTTDLGGMAQQGLGGRGVMMDAQGGGVVWHCGSVDASPGKVDASVHALKMDRWMMVVAASEGAPDRCDLVPAVVWLGHPALDVRLWCDVCLVLGSDYRHPFIK